MITTTDSLGTLAAKSYDAYLYYVDKSDCVGFVANSRIRSLLSAKYAGKTLSSYVIFSLNLHVRKDFLPEYFLQFTACNDCMYKVTLPTSHPWLKEYADYCTFRAWPSIEFYFQNGTITYVRAQFSYNEAGENVFLSNLGGSLGAAIMDSENFYRDWLRKRATDKQRRRAHHYDIAEWLTTLYSVNLTSFVWLWLLEFVDPDLVAISQLARLRSIDRVLHNIGKCIKQRSAKKRKV